MHISKQKAFTIIELLIVIVIIGVLVAITSVSYTGVTRSAKEAVIKSDLKQASTQLEIDKAKNNSYPTSTSGLKSSSGTNLEITSNGSTFCLSATSAPDVAFYITNTDTSPQQGICSGHFPPNTPTDLANNTPIQDVNRLQCNNLPIYTGTNDSALRTVTDNRDGTTRNYRIAKLADNKCWMLDNLKLGRTTGTTTLTPANTNIATNFTLPQLITTGTQSYDIPQAYGPVPGDTGSGATNYGYLYNWPASTAGETRTTMPAGSAQYSICPKNWRLPSGGVGVGDFADLDRGFGGTGQYASNGPSLSKWQNTGPFKGVFSGYWLEYFRVQSSWGGLWSSSAYPGNPFDAFYVGFAPSHVEPGGNGTYRYDGSAVRCILN